MDMIFSREFILVLHPTFGVLALIAAVWVFVEVLNTSQDNLGRIRTMSLVQAAFIWLAYLFGGYWYVQFYDADKAIIKAGPWPSAHGFFMETKEHLFLVLLLLSIYLPVMAFQRALLIERGARRLTLTVAALIVLLVLAMEGAGAIVGLGVKMGLLAR